ncbi:hypothetical protein BH11ARM2_BH11ARM2_29950 [soil metagenome]
MGDFIGLNTHTVQFKTDLYRPVTRVLRNYHPMEWDLGGDTSGATTFPMTHNGISWLQLYGDWKAKGFTIDASAQFESIDPGKWKDLAKDPYAYGEAFARYFGPSGEHKLLESVEIGNEPQKFSEAQYRTVFENMAKGLRKGDPKLQIATCAVAVGNHDQWSKDVNGLKGLEPLYDILNVHSYAMAEGWPTWRRSYPEDPKIPYLKQIQDVIDWRNANATGKKVWLTEFGWDSSTKKPTGDENAVKWIGNTDTEQARYIVRSYLVFSGMDIDRAYLYWFNDEDTASLHAASGLTRHYQPKPSYWAVAHLLKTLEGYRYAKTITQKEGEVYAYEYAPVKGKGDRVLAVWSPTGSSRTVSFKLPKGIGKVVRAERMPLTEGAPEKVAVQSDSLKVDESPVYVWLRGK